MVGHQETSVPTPEDGVERPEGHVGLVDGRLDGEGEAPAVGDRAPETRTPADADGTGVEGPALPGDAWGPVHEDNGGARDGPPPPTPAVRPSCYHPWTSPQSTPHPRPLEEDLDGVRLWTLRDGPLRLCGFRLPTDPTPRDSP